MYLKNLYQVPVDIETQALLQALRDGRLFIQPASVPACDTRAEVLSIITRIAAFASDESVVLSAWQALLADDARLRSFRLRQHQRPNQPKTTDWGQSPIGSFSPSPINRYRIAAIVRFMCEIGFYNMQMCRTAETTEQGQSPIGSFCTNPYASTRPCSFKALCNLLFPGEDADLYRRNCGAYSYYEDECIIRKFVCHE